MIGNQIDLIDGIADEIEGGAKAVSKALERLSAELQEIRDAEHEFARAQDESREGDFTRIDAAMERKIAAVENLRGLMLACEGEIEELMELLTIDVPDAFGAIKGATEGDRNG